MGDLPAWAYAAAVARACGGDFRRIGRALADRDPASAWAFVVAGGVGEAAALVADAVEPAAERAACEAAGVVVLVRGQPDYPVALVDDHEAPGALFAKGDVRVLDGARVGVIGTRRCTHYGRDVARQLGRELAEAGVCVVSGLAAGIDGAAHTGALEVVGAAGGVPPVAVVGSGLDVVYPANHTALWAAVAASGAVLTEAPLGTNPEAWRFPARNRVIAALSQVLVVVESHRTGGSMHTVRAADERGVPVMAVPGAIRSPASTGTNQLLADGCAPACTVDDVLAALSLAGGRPAAVPASARPAADGGPRVHPDDEPVLAAVDWAATPTEVILARSGLSPLELSVVLARLEEAGVVRAGGGWWERR
jgi:DNA processing protein